MIVTDREPSILVLTMIEVMQCLGQRIVHGDERIHLAGIDDAHYYRADNIEKAASGIPYDEFSILLSHTPEIYRQAAHADFNVMFKRLSIAVCETDLPTSRPVEGYSTP